jgi:hypothetical protein
MVEYLREADYARPIIVDNASSYPPLLEWYEKAGVDIIRLGFNGGPYAVWDLPNLSMQTGFYAVTDSDLDLSSVPRDLISHLVDVVRGSGLNKAGLSLEIDDLPDTQVGRQAAVWEKMFWSQRYNDHFFVADIDTTFAVYRAGSSHRGVRKENPRVTDILRSNKPYCCRHLPWYLTSETLTAEDQYYMDHADSRASWNARIKDSLAADRAKPSL